MLVLGLMACATTTTLGTPRTLPAGELQHTVGTEVGWVDSPPFASPLLRVDYGLRYGLTDDLEFGVNVGTWPLGARWLHAGVDAKYRLHAAPSDTVGWDVAVATSLAVDHVSGWGAEGQALTGQQVLLIGKNTARGHQWILAPRVAVERISSKGAAPITKGLIGFGFGPALQLRRLTVYPQVGWWWSTNAADVNANLNVWTLSWAVSWS